MHSLASLAAFSQSPLPPWHALMGGDDVGNIEINIEKRIVFELNRCLCRFIGGIVNSCLPSVGIIDAILGIYRNSRSVVLDCFIVIFCSECLVSKAGIK